MRDLRRAFMATVQTLALIVGGAIFGIVFALTVAG